MDSSQKTNHQFPLKPGQSVLITGGARSGKSRFAEQLASHGKRVVYLATAEALDPEMHARIEIHRSRRDPGWTTIEEPLELLACLKKCEAQFDLALIDCMTLWISNLMAAKLTDQEITARVDALVDYVHRPQFTLLLVTNEVGAGIVPEYPSGRRFRDLVGQSNQSLAAAAHAVYWLVSGIPVAVK